MVAKKRASKKKVTKKKARRKPAAPKPTKSISTAINGRSRITKKKNPKKMPNHGTTEGSRKHQFKKGQQMWRLSEFTGRYKIFESPEALLEACVRYINNCETSPLYEVVTAQYKGRITKGKVPKMRAMTITGLCLFIGISNRTWHVYRVEGHEFAEVANWVQDIIYQQKFEGAAAGLLNQAIVAREMSLREDHAGDDTKGEELADAFKRIAERLPT